MEIKNIAVLQGLKTTVKEGVIYYEPEFHETKSENGEIISNPKSADLRTEVNFIQGVISFKFKAESKNTGVLIIWEEIGKELIGAGLSGKSNFFTIVDTKSDTITTNGGLSQFKVNEEISVKFELLGSEARLYVNNILYCEQNLNLMSRPLSFRINSDGKVNLYDINVEAVKPKLFVVMQFTENFNNLYNDVIIPVAEKAGYEVIRADEVFSSTPILNDIIKSIKESSVIIADITPDNPNVFYEIGYAHAIKKPTILICDKTREQLPFDVSSFRTLFYENTISGKSKIEFNLTKYLENVF